MEQKIVVHIDDDAEDRELVEEAIHEVDKNIVVRQMPDGPRGISYLKQAKHFSDIPCLIVLDLNLPGMNGWDVLNEIKKDADLSAIPVVLYTTSSDTRDRNAAQKQGVELISKPATLKQVSETIHKLLSYCN